MVCIHMNTRNPTTSQLGLMVVICGSWSSSWSCAIVTSWSTQTMPSWSVKLSGLQEIKSLSCSAFHRISQVGLPITDLNWGFNGSLDAMSSVYAPRVVVYVSEVFDKVQVHSHVSYWQSAWIGYPCLQLATFLHKHGSFPHCTEFSNYCILKWQVSTIASTSCLFVVVVRLFFQKKMIILNGRWDLTPSA